MLLTKFISKIVRNSNSAVIRFQPPTRNGHQNSSRRMTAGILIVKEQIIFAWCYITNLFLVRSEFCDISFMASCDILVPTLFNWRFFHFLDVFCLGYAHASVWLSDGWTKVNNAIRFFFYDLHNVAKVIVSRIWILRHLRYCFSLDQPVTKNQIPYLLLLQLEKKKRDSLAYFLYEQQQISK